ncbi:Vacuolar protein sorting/targeting protein 10 [Penicillium argentinense]|uniref:Vacuolar protein sorting/targeting protein 10 n=1 Tax=Penicillium argentinense TaxID=1131581 RepID=A0A9W9G500_9EURO|nr:Vacuolar protein sorting/targeting protein 10 [Penicillium argentinense]KAJ5112068.1 Vacuolar protein sorting/targeting protein 10 [Penicillium argentinense]
MIPRWLLLVVGLLLLSIHPTTAKDHKLKAHSTDFSHQPNNLFYFQGSNTILFQDAIARNAYISTDGGKEWSVLGTRKGDDGKMEGEILLLMPHPFDEKRAYALADKGTGWVTTDRGDTWKKFEIKTTPNVSRKNSPFRFHGHDPKKVIFMGRECSITMCFPVAYYTKDDFKTVKKLSEEDATFDCSWAVGTPEFGQDLELKASIADRIMCVVTGAMDGRLDAFLHRRLVYSDDFFEDGGHEINLDRGRPVPGMEIRMVSVKKYIVVALQSRGTMEQTLYISDDSSEWHRAEFGDHRLEQDGYTILESTNYSIQVDVQTTLSENPVGVLFTSNSNGTYFTPNIRHTNRNLFGNVDFEKLADIQGIVIVNTVDNWEAVEDGASEKKKLVTQISFDDGRNFTNLKVDNENLHIHSLTSYVELHELAALGRMFSSPAPGLVMGVGNTGEYLEKYSKGNLYISDDAGLTWRLALEGPHRFEFGDHGGVIVAIKDDDATKKVMYSINHGKEWEKLELDTKIKPLFITTTPDSTSLKFILVGISNEDNNPKYTIYQLDFDDLHERKCDKNDFEEWAARLDENGKPDCLMGHKQIFHRRKSDAECFVKNEFKIDHPKSEKCKCSAEDFECDYNFKRSEDGKKCVPAVALSPPAGQCKDPSDTFKGPSGWRLIPGNTCTREGGKNLDEDVEQSCGNATSPPAADGKIRVGETHYFNSKKPAYYYLERQTSSNGDDETIFQLTGDKELWVTHDHGKTWAQPTQLKGENIVDVIPNRFYTDAAFFLTESQTAWFTVNRGAKFHKIKVPTKYIDRNIPPLVFHEKYMEWVLWIGSNEDCDSSSSSSSCELDAWYSTNSGQTWSDSPMLRGVGQCVFGYQPGLENTENLILCEQYQSELSTKDRQLVSGNSTGTQWFSKKDVKFENIAHFVTMDGFFVVATYPTEKHEFLNVSTSLDGSIFAQAHFPHNLAYTDVKQYTAVPGSGHALFMNVEANTDEDRKFGSLVKSNSNGTYFVSSLEGLSQSNYGYIDYERIAHLEGVAIANIVVNKDEVKTKSASKKLRTVITHNDGGQWALLPPPNKDVDGKQFDCSVQEGKGTDSCALHLHGYTERLDWRDTFYSGSAIGLLLGVGNVGEYLSEPSTADTFLSNDGGITWKNVKKGRYMWEFGDAGSVIVLVRELEPTKVIYYSLDSGSTWVEYQFSDTEMTIGDISTVPSDTSKNFLLWAKDMKSSSSKLATINLDFSAIYSRECAAIDSDDADKDYTLWTPKHPLQDDNCLFGHVEQYHRKKVDAECWVNWREPHSHIIANNCTCTRADFECDYNYEIQSDGSCALVPGLAKPDHSLACKQDPSLIEYYEPTGYRRLPQTTCQGGDRYNMDKGTMRPCPNKEDEFDRKHGISGAALFFAIIIPILAAAAFGYFVYTRWDGKFGQIRLGENYGSGSRSGQGWLSRDALITVPIAIIAGTVALAKALPLVTGSLWRSVSGLFRGRGGYGYQRTYSTRDSFARRGDYHVVDDEDELLGPDEFEEEEEA